jgi:anti-sigma regulatory factor (Ser/Thr protein kinase)
VIEELLTQPVQPTSPQLNVKIPSDPARIAEVRKSVEQVAASTGLDEQAVAEVGLCVNEALANVIRHAYGGVKDRPILVRAHCQDRMLVVTIRDWGNGVNPATLPPRPFDPLEPGGLGLICLRRMMNEVSYVPQGDGGMLLVMKKAKQHPDAGRNSERVQ